MKRVADIRNEFAGMEPDEKGMLEITACQFIANEPAVFGTPNEDWHERELEWYKSMSRSVFDIPKPIPKIWLDVSSNDGFGLINSNYGWCVWSGDNGFQYQEAVKTLHSDPYSRQAVMIYNRPSMHDDARTGGMRDFMCTNNTQLLYRDGKLDYLVYMRSSDAVFGYKGDLAWHKHVHAEASKDLEMPEGDIIWHAGSFHVYPRHIKLVEQWKEENWGR